MSYFSQIAGFYSNCVDKWSLDWHIFEKKNEATVFHI